MIHAQAQRGMGFKLSLGPAADLLTLKLSGLCEVEREANS